jgi:hypothetical protein
MRARQSLELYCEELLNRRAKPAESSGQTTNVKLQDINKRAM